MNWFPHADGWILLAIGLIAGHWLPRLAFTWRERKRLRRRLRQLKGTGTVTPITDRRRGA